ncbi:hypothetical protein D9M71_772880 [compost metagenome]
MGEVQADHVDAGAEQLIQHPWRVGSRSEGGKNLGASLAFGHGARSPYEAIEISTFTA